MLKKDKLKLIVKIVLALVIIVGVLIYMLISNIIDYITDDQRAIDYHSSQIYKEAVETFEQGFHDEALLQLDSIDPTWSKYNKVNSLKTEVVHQVLLEDATELLNVGKHEELLEYITTHVDDPSSDDTIKAIFDQAANVYREKILSAAYEAYLNNGADGVAYAMTILNNALSVMPEDQILKKEIEEYENCYGENLLYLDPYYCGDHINSFGEAYTDTNGIIYNTGFTAFFTPQVEGDSYCLYRMNGEYDRLTATAFIHSSDRNEEGVATFTIYGDDIPLMTQSLNKDSESIDIDLNIQGVDILKIEAYGSCPPTGHTGITCNLGDVMVSKVKAKPLYY